MGTSAGSTGVAKINFYLNLLNAAPFLIAIITGLVIQINFHMHRLPDDSLLAGLSRSGWLLAHKISATMALTGVIAHCIAHRKHIAGTTRRIIRNRSLSKVIASYYLLIIFIPTSLAAMTSWIFFSQGDATRFTLVELHDKLALLLAAVSIVHILSRTGWMIKTGRRLFKLTGITGTASPEENRT